MKPGRGLNAGNSERERPLLTVSLAPDPDARGDTGPALNEAQFVAQLTRRPAGLGWTRDANAGRPCAN